MNDYKETIREMKKEITQLRKTQDDYQDIVNYCFTDENIVQNVKQCRFLRDAGIPTFEE